MSGERAEAARADGGLLPKLKWLVGVRLLLASALLGSAGVLDLHERMPFRTIPLYGLLGLTFGLSLVYALALRSQRRLFLQGLAQLVLDLGLVSLLVHYTGGLDSVLPFMYIFVVFAAATLLDRRGVLLFGILSGFLYGSLVAAEWTRVIPPAEFAGGLAPLRSIGYAVYQVLIHGLAFLAVALLSSHLAHRLRQAGQELEKRGLDLRNLQTLHSAILANISSGLLTLDLTGRVVSLNEAGERITGYDFATLRDHSWRETPFAVCPTLSAFFAAPSAPLAGRVAELTLIRRDGQSIPVGVSYSPLRDAAGEAAGLVVTFQDLTERKQVEEHLRQADRLAALGQLAANIAHEIRNPLGAISGAVEVLRADLPAAGTNRELLDIIFGEAHRLKLITGQFLDFAKPQSALCRPCALRPLLEETLQLLGRSAECHPAMTWAVAEDSPGLRVFADADQLRQVIWNLCLNAMQAMPGGGHLGVRVRPASRPVGATGEGAWVEIAVADSGQGISPQGLERLFDPFYTTRPAGTGLGLAIARKILESMGGQIAVESRVGVGSTFRVWLRRADLPPQPHPEAAAA